MPTLGICTYIHDDELDIRLREKNMERKNNVLKKKKKTTTQAMTNKL